MGAPFAASDQIARYLLKQAEVIPEASALPAPSRDTRLIVVIPALAERAGLPAVLRSLPTGSRRLSEVELIVVVNNPASADPAVVAENARTLEDLRADRSLPFPLLVLDRSSAGRALPDAIAGVGAARRVGMDLAFRRLVQAGTVSRGVIACLDADSPVGPGYLDAVLRAFEAPAPPLAAVCAFRHPLPEEEPAARAMVAYELWLRYFEAALRYCGSPFAYHAVGSCIVTSARGYALADGLPRRQAGEDFYFLQKIVKQGGPGKVASLDQAVVHPSARVSDRVPFGTGRAMRRCREQGEGYYLWAEPPAAFADLRTFLREAPAGFHDLDGWLRSLPPGLARFLERKQGRAVLASLRDNAADAAHFGWAVCTWFDSLQMMRYARRCKQELGGKWIFEAFPEILAGAGQHQTLADLPIPDPARSELALQVRWLERLRAHATK